MEAMGEDPAGGAGPWAVLPGAAVLPEARFRGLRSVPAGTVQLAGLAAAFGSDLASDGGGSGGLARGLELLKGVCSTAAADAALMGFREAADFAAKVEDASRAIGYLQVVAAGAVNRSRREATLAARSGSGSGAAVGWVTGWGAEAVAHDATGWVTGSADSAENDMCDGGAAANGEAESAPEANGWPASAQVESDQGGSGLAACQTRGGRPAAAEPDPADDGFRNAEEFLRGRLRISGREARRRIALADSVLPRTGFTGHTEPAEREELGAALAAGTIASQPATIITLALDQVRRHAPDEALARMEHALTRTAAENDADYLSKIARRWINGLDQDGPEPSEEELRRRQGAFIRPTRHGLHHLEIFATPDQFEPLLTVMNTATNPRTTTNATGTNDSADGDRAGQDTATTGWDSVPGVDLDRRTRPQRHLDGLVGACKAALTTGTLPTAGGLRPQVMVTIDYVDLLDRLEHETSQGPRYRNTNRSTAPSRPTAAAASGPGAPGIPGTGSFTFTGPINAATVRKIACDADIIPVLLGSEGRILDIGRTTRIFPPHIRKAITARDQGCAFPNCTIPAPWCEAHHITYWSHGGTTGTDNGTLLCSHHHHLIHKEQWTIHVKNRRALVHPTTPYRPPPTTTTKQLLQMLNSSRRSLYSRKLLPQKNTCNTSWLLVL